MLADLNDRSDEPARWGHIAVHIRLVTAGPAERDSVLNCIGEVVAEIAAASPESKVTAAQIVENMWKESGQRAPAGDARRARYCANLARAAAALDRPALARDAIVSADEAIKDSPRQEEDRSIIDVARTEISAR